MLRCFSPTVLFVLALVPSTLPAQAPQSKTVRHPNLLLNREEIEQVKQKIKQYPWAAALWARVKALADQPGVHPEGNLREAALAYVLSGQPSYGEKVREHLVHQARSGLAEYAKVNLRLQPEYGAWGPWGVYAWAYDLTWDRFRPEERQLVERWLRTVAQTIIEGEKLWTTTPNLVFDKHCRVGLIGYCLGDAALIDWALRDPGAHGPHRGGFYAVLDSMIQDGYFWGEAPIYALHYDVHNMLALAEAAHHYDGTNLYDYVSKKSGASIRSILEGYLRMAFPRERTGIGRGSLRLATFGDGSTSYGPLGTLHDTFLANPPGRPAPGELLGELELAYRHYKDPGYAWFLSLNPQRDTALIYGRAVWGYVALTHGLPLPAHPQPPAAPSGVYPKLGFAMLRADESPRYWTSGGLAAVLRLGTAVGHGHEDYYSLILHGKGRLLYPDLNVVQYEPTYLNWTHEGIAHNTLLVDHQSPRPGKFTTRQDFSSEVKFFAVSGSAFPQVMQTRALLLTPDYLVDIFQASDTRLQERTFDWVLHGLGRLYPGNPQAYQPTHALLPFYWWVDNERGRRTDDTWQADWLQHSAGITPGAQPLGREWFEQTIGVRLTMLGAPGTEVYYGDGPLTDGPPYHRIEGNPEGSSPLIVARRRGTGTVFVAVHEPYEQKPLIQQIRRLDRGENKEIIALKIIAPQFTDYILVALTPEPVQVASPEGEFFAFRNYGYLHLSGKQLQIRGAVHAFEIPWSGSEVPRVLLQGQEVAVQRLGKLLRYGTVPARSVPEASPAPAAPTPEQRAYLHYWFLPEEVHLRAGGSGQVTLHLCCIGQGTAQGALRVQAPPGISVEPAEIKIPPLDSGEERQFSLHLKAPAGAPSRLDFLDVEPVGQTPAARAKLPVSIGVVITEDRRLPRLAQYVVRAPNYTLKVDQYSGVSYYLLDAEGHRRHGRIHNTNFITGFPGILRQGTWCFRYREPCRFIWKGGNTLTVGCEGIYNDGDARFQYIFHPESIEIALISPTRPDIEHHIWLGNFDALGAPQHNGTQRAPHEPIIADRFFFPHPVYRQGLFLTLPAATPLHYLGSALHFPLRTGQKVRLQFVTSQEARTLLEPVRSAQEKKAAASPATRREVTVGLHEGDYRGADGQTIQNAIDAVARQGGGRVLIRPGRYTLRQALILRSNVDVVGTPGQTILTPEKWLVVPLAQDASAGAQEITLTQVTGLQIGDGVMIRDDRTSGFAITSATLVARTGDKTFRLSQPLVHSYARQQKARVARLFPLIGGWQVQKVLVEGLTLEGCREQAPFYQFADGCRTAGIYLYQCADITLRNCCVRHYPGDGISFQWQSRGIVVEDCLVEENNVFGIHPGSDSHHSLVRRNRILRNGGPGLFVCVGVQHVCFEKNILQDNQGPGISIGCRDTDNVFRDNTITGNGRGGILFRDDWENGQPAGAHRNVFEKNFILDNQPAKGEGSEGSCITIQGRHEGLIFRENTLGNSRPGGPSQVGIRLDRQTPQPVVEGNRFLHLPKELLAK